MNDPVPVQKLVFSVGLPVERASFDEFSRYVRVAELMGHPRTPGRVELLPSPRLVVEFTIPTLDERKQVTDALRFLRDVQLTGPLPEWAPRIEEA